MFFVEKHDGLTLKSGSLIFLIKKVAINE